METITPHELRERTGRIAIYDIRGNPDDRRIPGSVRAEGEALESATGPPFGKDEEVVLYCGSGNSCSRIARTLRERGYRAAALEGGYKAWVAAGLPVEERGAGSD